MTTTVNINLSGIGFTIDEPAYRLLKNYLDSLQELCRNADTPEVATDIEQRIAEILCERCQGGRIIGETDIEEIITRIGSPDDIVEPGASECASSGQEAAAAAVPPPLATPAVKKRLYRDPRNKMLGGVCSGLGWYFGIDPVWIRLAFVALCFLSASTIVFVYIVLWIVIPQATTPVEQLQMMGMEGSVSNVGKVVTDTVPPPAFNGGAGSGHRLAQTVTEIFGWIGKALFYLVSGVGLLVCAAILIALCVGFVACLIALLLPHGPFNPNISITEVKLTLGCVVGAISTVGIPLFLLVRWLAQSFTGRHTPLNPGWKRTLMICWIVGLALLLVCGISLDLTAVSSDLYLNRTTE